MPKREVVWVLVCAWSGLTWYRHSLNECESESASLGSDQCLSTFTFDRRATHRYYSGALKLKAEKGGIESTYRAGIK